MKNKEIEELLNKLKECRDDDELFLIKQHSANLLLSYIEQLEKEIEEYQKELEKADSITQSCIFNGKKDSEISYRKCLNLLEKYKEKNKQLENNRDKAIEYFKFENPEIFKNPKYSNHLWTIDGLTIKRFINILKGDSDE